MLSELENRINSLDEKISSLMHLLKLGALDAYPDGFSTREKALPYTAFPDLEALREACKNGAFEYGPELRIIGPITADEPAFRLNISAIQHRIQSPLLAAA